MANRSPHSVYRPVLFIMEGAAARQDGKLRDRCPYPDGTEEAWLWLKGWGRRESADLIVPRLQG